MMTRSWIRALAASLTLSATACGIAAAQSTELSAAGSAGRALTSEDLGRMLENMGHAAKKTGESSYEITIVREGWSFPVAVSLSTNTNGSKLWLCTTLGEIKDFGKVQAERFSSLLASNDKIGPAHFYISVNQETGVRKLGIGKALDNRGITPLVLLSELGSFIDSIKKTADLWDVSKWEQQAAAQPESGSSMLSNVFASP